MAFQGRPGASASACCQNCAGVIALLPPFSASFESAVSAAAFSSSAASALALRGRPRLPRGFPSGQPPRRLARRAGGAGAGGRELAYPCVNPSLTLPMQHSAPARSPSLQLQGSASAALSEDIIGDSTEKMDTVVAELASFFQALKSGSLFGYLILLASVLTGLPPIIVAVAYLRIAIERFQTASKATQENFERIAADLRKRALEVKKQDEGLRKRDLEVKERDELKESESGLVQELAHDPAIIGRIEAAA
jgi:hypothetical protein